MVVELYIGLYEGALAPDSGLGGRFHWALIPTESASIPTVSAAVKAFDITDEGSPGNWRRQTEADDILTRSTFKCLVKLPDIESITYADVCSFLDEQSPHQGSTPLQTSHLQWSCALWIIRGLALLNEAGLSRLDLENDEQKVKFYRRIRALGMLVYSNGPWVGYELAGIKIIDYEHGL